MSTLARDFLKLVNGENITLHPLTPWERTYGLRVIAAVLISGSY